MRRFVAVVLASLLVFASTPLTFAAAQSTGTITGVARATAGQPLGGHSVRVRSVRTGDVVATVTTSANGSFVVANLNPGSYVVEIVDTAGRIVGTSAIATVVGGSIASAAVTAASTELVGGQAAGTGPSDAVIALLIAGGAAAVSASSWPPTETRPARLNSQPGPPEDRFGVPHVEPGEAVTGRAEFDLLLPVLPPFQSVRSDRLARRAPCSRIAALFHNRAVRRRAGRSGVAVTGDSPEKHRGGIVGHCHGAADQDWSSAAVAAAGVFQTDRRRAAPYRPPPHSCLPGSTRGAQWSSGLERILLNLASDATHSGAGNRIVSLGTA